MVASKHLNEMRDFSQIENILDEQKVSEKDQQLIRDFLISFSFQKRQQLMGIFLGFPGKMGLFIDLMKKKKTLAGNKDAKLAQEILDLEDREIDNLIGEINRD